MKHYVSIKNICNNENEFAVGPLTKEQVVDVVNACDPSEDFVIGDVMVLSFDEFMAEQDTTPKLIIKKQIIAFDVEINYTASDWQLYTSVDMAEGAAKSLNSAIIDVLRIGATSWLDLYRECEKMLAQYRNYGATDTEPLWVLIDLLRELGMPEGVV